LYHTAILYPERKDLAVILKRLTNANYPLSGAADHGVSEALYLNDPDGNGVELYWDKPKEQWPLDVNGNLQMVTEPLDVDSLVAEANE
jgi:catechol 2,3-dioxygenase